MGAWGGGGGHLKPKNKKLNNLILVYVGQITRNRTYSKSRKQETWSKAWSPKDTKINTTAGNPNSVSTQIVLLFVADKKLPASPNVHSTKKIDLDPGESRSESGVPNTEQT